MYRIKIMDDPREPQLRERMLLESVYSFLQRENDGTLQILRTEKGKPYVAWKKEPSGEPAPGLLPAGGVHVSISHSGGFWSCVVSSQPCGLDLQQLRDCDFHRLAERFFTMEERDYVIRHGLTGFYEIWTRREALAKYTGLGFFGMGAERPSLVELKPGKGLPAFIDNTLAVSLLKDSVTWEGKSVRFESVEAPEGYLAVWCCSEGENKL